MKTKIKLEENDQDIKPIAVRAFAVVISFFVVWFVAVVLLAPKMKGFVGIGAFGDAFGVINALFSGLALAAVAVTLWLSLKQLKVQQAELRENTEALQGQREQLEIHNKFLTKQSVQNQFFQMLESWQRITHHLERRASRSRRLTEAIEESTGRSAIVKAAYALLRELRVEITSQEDDLQTRRSLICIAYNKIAMTGNFHLGNYFRLFYHIIRIIDKSAALDDEEKKDLVRVLRAHLSEAELILLLYNCVTPFGEKLRILVEDYDLLQNLSEHGVSQECDLDFFPKTKARWKETGNLRSDK